MNTAVSSPPQVPICIDTIRISGFRGIKCLEMSLARVTVLIGANNSGKTSVLKALQLAFGDYSRYLTEEDFYIDSEGERVNEILIDARIVPQVKDGEKKAVFREEWATEFGDKIKAEANGNQYVALRTRAKRNEIKGGFDSLRYTLERWPDYPAGQTEKIKETKLSSRLLSLPFISIEAQRDIVQELKEKASFVGKILSSVEYKDADIENLEELIQDINDEAVSKSEALKRFKAHLEQLNQSFQGAGNVEVTPFPKKIRDLSKHFSVHFGDTSSSTFSMEYHGMGTRSWASLLTVRAFVGLLADKHEEEVEAFFPILAAEEPEAHLHPNAQKTLYKQLAELDGQVIISTHSPYFTAMSDVSNIRSLRREHSEIVVKTVYSGVSKEEKKILAREITAHRGDILFSRALILCEGVTEEQLIPAMFEVSVGRTLFSLGISCVNVGGKNYAPFIKLACSLGVPTYIVSDNDGNTKNEIESQLRRVKKDMQHDLGTEIFGISYITNGNDFEAELLDTLGLKNEILSALLLSETKASENIRYRDAKLKKLNNLTDAQILECMRDSKASYSGYLADILRKNPENRQPNELIPIAVQDSFEVIRDWFAI